jgi:hypothetical protein
MLTASMKEKASRRIELTNIKLQTGKDLLYYLYNQRMKQDSDVMGLLAVADQYDLPDLKTLCGEALAASVTRADVFSFFFFLFLTPVPCPIFCQYLFWYT